MVIMPAYNAGKTIEKVFERIPSIVQGQISRYVVVDDGSTDDTNQALARIAKRFSNLDLLQHPTNRGYGAAEKTLLKFAVQHDAQVAVLLHSDGQYAPEKIPDILAPFNKDKADIVQGSRMLGGGALKGGMPFYKFIANKCLTALENWSFGMNMAEYHSGYMAYSKKSLLAIPFQKLSNSFDFDLEMLVAAKILGLRIAEIPIPTIYGNEVSHLNPLKYGFDVLAVIRKFRKGKYHSLLGMNKDD